MNKKEQQQAVWSGVILGVYQAHALFWPIGAMVMFATDHVVFAGLLSIGSAVGWAGWKRDYDLRWRP